MIISFTRRAALRVESGQTELYFDGHVKAPRLDSIIIINTRDSLLVTTISTLTASRQIRQIGIGCSLAVPAQLRYRNFFRFPARR